MVEFVLDRLHPLLQQLVLYQRAKREVKGILTAVKGIVVAEWSSDTLHKQERAACEAAILIALRVGAESSIVTECWRRDRTGYAAIVHACLQQDQRRNSESMQHSSIKFHHVHPLLSALLSDVEGDSSAIFTILQAVYDMCQAILCNDILRKEFLSSRHVPLYGKLVSVCLEIVSNISKDSRRVALKTLEAVVEASEQNCSSLCVVLPGLSSWLAGTICESASEQLDVITTSLKIISMAVRFCLADSVKDDELARESEEIRPEILELLVKRDDEWKSASAGNITKIIRTLCSTLAVHHDEEVRSTLLVLVDSIRSDCKSAFSGTLDAFLMDLLLTVLGTTSTDSEIAARLRAENITAFSLHMHEKLRELAERIPLNVRKKTTDSGILFHQLAGVLSCLDVDVSRLATSRSPSLEAMFSALAASFRVDARRLLISRGQIRESSVEFLKSLPLCFDVQIGWILPICKLLASHGGIEVVEIAASAMVESCRSDRASLAILTALVLADMEPQTDSHVLYSLAETCIDWIKEVRPEEHTRDDIIEHKIPVPSEDTILTVALVSLLAVTFTRIEEQKEQLKLLVAFLYQLLGLYAITNWIVHDAADCALSQIATAMSLSVSEFLYERGAYIVHHIALAARSRTEHDHAPVVFSALLERVDDPRMFEHVRHIVDDLLQALDKFKQAYCILILRSMLAFVTAVGRWFPELNPTEEEEIPCKEEELSTEEQAIMESEKKPPPAPIQSVQAVLLRTKHLLSSSHFPIRILVMRILREGLWVIRNFDDQLLPMVHQNWEALINRFRDEEMEVRQEAVRVVTQMVRVSKTFVYRRVRHQMWPIVDKWMRDASTHLYSTTSAAYKYQLCVLQSIAEIFIGIDASTEDVQLVLEMLKLYCGKMGSPQLKKEAESARKQLEAYIEDRNQRTLGAMR
ncbi:hypothetical protein Y032_0059g2997 [Ancylostoma ceylanicum]|uniref:HEAT repeat protein n=1 Tax=Ancylostoma ceylanicum TaxID=53326 RepID=A0A016U4Z9_9BILA|nr:hypothetical protein Y032_0059g2997 [Ancylostoma ceylanicum]